MRMIIKSLKKLFVISSFAFLISTVLAFAEEAEYKEVTGAMAKQIEQYDVPLNTWKYRKKCDERCLQPELPKKLNWKSAAPGLYWPEAHQTFWFRKVYTVPEKIAGRETAGSKIILKMNVSDGGEAYANGKKVGGVTDGGAVIAESAVPGEEIVIGVRVWNGTWPGAYLGASLSFSTFDEIKSKTQTFIDRVDEAEYLIPFSDEKEKWTGVLNEAAGKINLDALKNYDEPAYFASLDLAKESMQQLEGLFKNYTLYLASYSHIDLAWLWDKAEGEEVVRDTLNTVYILLEEYPEWVYAHAQAHSVKWMEDDYPEVYAKLKEYFENGRIEIVGGTWSEHDSNIPGGEGLVRQFLYGKRYFREKFGKDIVVAWTPDSFGYNWNLPQILVKSGMKGFLTQKLGSNESTRFPHKLFWWQGVDGSKVLTVFPPSGYANPVYRKPLISQLAAIKKLHNVNENFVIFGVGNHGGGLTRGHLDRAFALKNDRAAPNVVFTSAENYYEHLHELAKTVELPTWNDELYLEHHRGTYTTHADTKKNNRRCEQLLMDAEKLATIANVEHGVPYPAGRLFDSGWYFVLLNHMHDILPGSGIRKVFEDAQADYAVTRKTANEIINNSLTNIAESVNTEGEGEPLLVFNTLSWKRDAIVEYPFEGLTEKARVVAPDGKTILSQVTQKDGMPHILFIARDLPPVGYTVYRVLPDGGAGQEKPTDLSTGDDFFENTFLKVAFDPVSGELKSVFDKLTSRELLSAEKNSNVVQAFKDTQNAWEIMSSEPVKFNKAGDAEVIESGPVRVTLKTSFKIKDSTIEQHVSLYEKHRLVHGRIDMDWRNHNITTKLAFNLNLLNDDAWFEIPYAAIPRKAIAKTKAEKAKFEVSAHKWVDYTDQDNSVGISLLNNSKYGFDVKHNVLRMTLLRSPITPDPEADIGKHSIEYALYTHPGDWRDSGVPRRGYEFNYTPHVISPGAHGGSLPATHSFFSAKPGNVALTAVKMAEDGDGIIIRLVETDGRAGIATIRLPWAPKKVVETNLIEDELKDKPPIKPEGNTLSVPFGNFEIKTLKLFL